MKTSKFKDENFNSVAVLKDTDIKAHFFSFNEKKKKKEKETLIHNIICLNYKNGPSNLTILDEYCWYWLYLGYYWPEILPQH